MKVVHINTYDCVGGAAVAMYRLHHGLRRIGHDSELLVGQQTRVEPHADYVAHQARPYRTLKHKVLDRIGAQAERLLGEDRWSHSNSWLIGRSEMVQECDVVNLHNLHGDYFNLRALGDLSWQKPVVWTLHDMAGLTGHCAYPFDCLRWRTGCYDCPMFREEQQHLVEPKLPRRDRTRQQWAAKRRLYQRARLHIITPSAWLQDRVRESILADARDVSCVPNGVDLEVFKPLDQGMARQALGLPTQAQVILFSAESVSNGRKGFGYLLEALARLPVEAPIWLLTTGSQAKLGPEVAHFAVRQLGYLSDPHLQRLALAAADLFVFPSLADNQPLVLIEALACGVPIVAFDVGGVPEMVRPDETGYRARYRDAVDLARGIVSLLRDEPLRAHMRRRCREIAEAEYSIETQVERYIDIYEKAIEDAHALSNA